MKTDDLILVLSADAGSRSRPVGRALALAIGAGGLAAIILFATTMGARLDISSALATWRFDLKLALLAGAFVAAVVDCLRVSSPTADGKPNRLVLVVVALLAAAVGLEIGVTPQAEWWPQLVGTNALLCLSAIPMLAVVPLLTILHAMRSGAPRLPARAGQAAGTLAASAAALLYATHCFDDSPLFVATWYTLAIALVSLVGAVVGARVLKW